MRYLMISLIVFLILLSGAIYQDTNLTLNECIQSWEFVNDKHQLLKPNLSSIPVLDIWIGYGNYSEQGQEGINAPLFREMRQRYWMLAFDGDKQVVLALYTHVSTPDWVYIFPMTVLASDDGANHGVCSFYKARISDVRAIGIRW